VNYWSYLTKALKNNQYIVGYDPLNEPAPVGNDLSSWITAILFDEFDDVVLQPMLERLYNTFKA
jgi:hypothetical protein